MTTTASRLGVGIIGTGFGLRALLPAFERTGRARVVAVAGSSAERARRLGGSLGIPLLTGSHADVCAADEVELIVVASPNDLHLEHAEAALATGKHVYIEKPVGLDAVQARRIDALAVGGGRLVVVGHSLRLDPCVRALRELVQAGAIGRVYHASVVQCGSALAPGRRPPDWQRQSERGGGVRLGTGSHMVDLVGYVLDAAPVTVSATASPAAGAEACFSALVAYPDAAVQLLTTAAAHVPPRFDVVLHGEEGDLTLSSDRELLLHRVDRKLETPAHERAAPERGSALFDVALTYLVEAVVDAILTGRTEVDGAATPADAVRCMDALDAALESIGSGATVRVRVS